ncbi:MAG TPA: prolyl oligopeptidase family serine peptidase [Fimbriimonas sp.]
MVNVHVKLLALLAVLPMTADAQEQADKYQWLEDVWGKRQLDWVRARNQRTADVIEKDPRFKRLEAQALRIQESPDRLPVPEFRNGVVFNFWQDAEHPQGIYRRTSLESYLTKKPEWKTLIDYDALSKKDNVKWVRSGIVSMYPNDRYSLVGLSAGGEDAETLREFDLKSGKFVPKGFVLPKSKQNVAWIDKDTLLVLRDWGKGTMTASGYPFVAKVWKRGTPLASAQEVYRGKPEDVSVYPATFNDAQGNQVTILIRGLDFFRSEVHVWTPEKIRKMSLPEKTELAGLVDGRFVVTLNEDWTPAGQDRSFKQGSVVSIDLANVKDDPENLKPTLVFEPTEREFAQQVATTRDRILLKTLENVQGRVYVYKPQSKGAWDRTKLAIPDNRAVSIVTTNEDDGRFFLSLSGFISPPSLLLGDASTGALKVAKTRKPLFKASDLLVEQLEATSTDGTKIPYFVVRRKDLKYDGSNPTLLTAYGGFQSSSTPYYSGTVGKLWLERGGVYVLANIRGGGEFGPAWHQAGLKTKRQVIYDDFIAVSKDLIARKITSPRRLGIEGGSNGGLLVGVAMTQRPDLFNAVVIDVPLLDMLRYEKIAAGASWVGEYGSVSVPEERRFLARISPYNQLKPAGKYPEPLIFTTTKDDRVGPVHARKFAARMEEFKKPFFYYEIIEGGHGGSADLKQAARNSAVTFTYLIRKLMD